MRGTVTLAENSRPRRRRADPHPGTGAFALAERVRVRQRARWRHVVTAQRGRLTAASQTVTVTDGGPPSPTSSSISRRCAEEVTVTTTAVGDAARRQSFNAVTTVDSLQIAREPPTTVGEALEHEPGVANRSFGPDASRQPVIRGFGGERVLIIEDGIRTWRPLRTSDRGSGRIRHDRQEAAEHVRTRFLRHGHDPGHRRTGFGCSIHLRQQRFGRVLGIDTPCPRAGHQSPGTSGPRRCGPGAMMDEAHMKRAVAPSVRGVELGHGGPFGAAVVRGGAVVGEGWNEVLRSNDPTAHAAVVTIGRACRKLETRDLTDCEIDASCEPYPLCLGAVYWSRRQCLLSRSTAATPPASSSAPSRPTRSWSSRSPSVRCRWRTCRATGRSTPGRDGRGRPIY